MIDTESSTNNHYCAEKGYIFEIQKLSTEDGPGIRTTVFLKECPLKCLWCHNPESIPRAKTIQWIETKCIACQLCVETCPTHSLQFQESGLRINRETCQACGLCAEHCPTTALKVSGEWRATDDIFNEILKDRVYYEKSGGGVTFSGGEPTIQIDFLVEILHLCKTAAIQTAVDTCGLASREKYARILPYVDILLLDIKEIDPIRHRQFTGVSNDQILANIQWLATKKSQYPNLKIWIRTPLIPGYTARDDNIIGIATFILQKMGTAVERWDLLAFNNMAKAKYERLDLEWNLATTPLLTKAEMRHFRELAQKVGCSNVEWDGLTQKPID